MTDRPPRGVPPAWDPRSNPAARRLIDRATFAGALLVFLVIGILWVGDLATQWWLLAIPVLICAGPVRAWVRQRGTHGDG